ncbi:hypothetical protein [Cyanobium sp. NIES-981]|uniref:hypothetical protein n=1 Tax=Cyanobium sp. NIES-981 TaxID=1851505 RepID=UPI0012FC999D|nr:hypothetical protein [Cyanobium sp. NIES-981]
MLDLKSGYQKLLESSFLFPATGFALAERLEKDSSFLLATLSGEGRHPSPGQSKNLESDAFSLYRTALTISLGTSAQLGLLASTSEFIASQAYRKQAREELDRLATTVALSASLARLEISPQWSPSGQDCKRAVFQLAQAFKQLRDASRAWIRCLAENPPTTEGEGPFGPPPASCLAEETAFKAAWNSVEVASSQVTSQCGGFLSSLM